MKNVKFIAIVIPILFFVFLTEFLNSQPVYPYKVWDKIYNAPSNLQDSAVSVKKNSLGMVFVAGWSLGTSTSADIVALRYNPDTGDTIWTKRFIGANEDKTTAMSCDNNGVYITGWSFSGVNRDAVTIKFNAVTGDTVWVKKYNGPANGGDYGYSITNDAGFVYVCGRTDVGGAQKYLIIKYNINTGDTIWTYKYNGTYATTGDVASSIQVDGSGNIYVTGKANFTPGPGDMVTIKLSSTGGLLWEKRYLSPANYDDAGIALVLDNTGSNVFVTGTGSKITVQDYITIKYSAATGDSLAAGVYNNVTIDIPISMVIDASSNVTVTGWSLNASNRYAYATVRYNSNLVQQWVARSNAADGYDLANHITLGTAGDVYVTGSSFKTGQGYDIYTVRYNSTGDTIWTVRYNGSGNGNDYGSEVAVIDTTKVFVTGSVIVSPATTTSMYTARYSSQIVGIRPISTIVPAKFNVEQNYPNPFNPSTTFEVAIPKEANVNITVYDVLGKAVEVLANQELKPGTYEVTWNASKYSSGMYFYRVQTDGNSVTKKMILAK